MAKVIVTQNMEPGWSNQRSGRGEPQSPAAAKAPVDPPVPTQADMDAEDAARKAASTDEPAAGPAKKARAKKAKKPGKKKR